MHITREVGLGMKCKCLIDGEEYVLEVAKIDFIKKEIEVFKDDTIVKTKDYYILRSTGLCDKLGEELIEDDIVDVDIANPRYYRVEFIEGGFCLTNPKLKGYPTDINLFYGSVGCQLRRVGNFISNGDLLNNDK